MSFTDKVSFILSLRPRPTRVLTASSPRFQEGMTFNTTRSFIRFQEAMTFKTPGSYPRYRREWPSKCKAILRFQEGMTFKTTRSYPRFLEGRTFKTTRSYPCFQEGMTFETTRSQWVIKIFLWSVQKRWLNWTLSSVRSLLCCSVLELVLEVVLCVGSRGLWAAYLFTRIPTPRSSVPWISSVRSSGPDSSRPPARWSAESWKWTRPATSGSWRAVFPSCNSPPGVQWFHAWKRHTHN